MGGAVRWLQRADYCHAVAQEDMDLVLGDLRATIAPHEGGRLAQLDLGRGPLLRPRDEADLAGSYGWAQWGSYPLAPWSNRIADGRFTFDGVTHQLPINYPDGTAIHGLVAATAWSVTEQSATSATLRTTTDTPPYTVAVEQRFTLHPEGLHQELAVTNGGDRAVPVGLGIHPWFRASPFWADVSHMWPAGDDCLPTGPPVPVDTDHDVSLDGEGRRRVPPTIDTCFTGIGERRAVLDDLIIEWSDDIDHLVVYTGVPGWICVEPVTNANDAFNLDQRGINGTGTRVLGPGDSTSCRYRFLVPPGGTGVG